MSGIGEPPRGIDREPSDPEPLDREPVERGPSDPEPAGPEAVGPEPVDPELSGEAPESPAADLAAESSWDVRTYGNRRRPTRAEQAVPWLIGLVLALSGMMIVLLALIFSSNQGLLPAYGTASPDPSTDAATPTPRPTPTLEPSVDPSLSAEPTPTPAPAAAYPPLEMVFMQRTAQAGPAHLFTHDFAVQAEPVAQARDNRGVDNYDWAPDGAHGIALIKGDPLLLTPGSTATDLGDGFDGIAYTPDSVTAYAVRATLAGGNDQAELLQIITSTGAVTSLATWTYPHPVTYQETVLREAQFADDGGFNRVYVLHDGRIVVWILGAPAIWTYDPATGATGTTDRLPLLWSPNGQMRIELTESGSNTVLTVRGLANEARSSIGVAGLVSHVRWSRQNNQVVFTLTSPAGTAAAQDLYLWDVRGTTLEQLTQDQRSLGGEFRGVENEWHP